jgi:hypothetical protein
MHLLRPILTPKVVNNLIFQLSREFVFLNPNQHRMLLCFEKGYEQKYLKKKKALDKVRRYHFKGLLKFLVVFSPICTGLQAIFFLHFKYKAFLFSGFLVTIALLFSLLVEFSARIDFNSEENHGQ